MVDKPRRLRSGTVILGGMGALAAVLIACGSEPDKRCVDRDSYLFSKGYRVVDSKDCKSGKSGRGDAAWYYGGTEKSGRVDGGSFTKQSRGSRGSDSSSGSSGSSSSGGSSYDSDSHSGVSRGGFGGSSGSGGG
jgi:hypothetical protein